MRSIPRLLHALAFSLLAAVAVPAAHAITPESGFWYNVNEPGTGISIEITDNFLFLAAYGFDTAGFPTWYTSGNFMTSDRAYSGVLTEFRNGQRFGQPYMGFPANIGNTGGNITIAFDPNDETKATISWFGRIYQIQRTDIFRSLYGTTNNIHQTQRMLGEWSVVIDLYNRSADYRAFPYYGDVLIFDQVDTTTNPDFFEGCRPTNSLTGYCTSGALSAHDAAGYFDPPGGDQHVIIVKDAPASGSSPAVYFAYYVAAGLTQFDGVMAIYNQGGNPANGPFYPVRGFRTASRKYVVDGSGPNAVEPNDKLASEAAAPSIGKRILEANNGVLPEGMTAAEVKSRYGIDVVKLSASMGLLEQRIQDKAAGVK